MNISQFLNYGVGLVFFLSWVSNSVAFHRPLQQCRVGTDSNCTVSGEHHTLAIDPLGNVWASGRNDYGQLGLGIPESLILSRPAQISGLQNIVRVYASGYSSYAIDGSGKMYAWGLNDQCQLGNGNRINQRLPEVIFNTDLDPAENIWKYQSSGTDHVLEVRKDGSLWAWGSNDKGQLGQGNRNPYADPVAILPHIKFSAVYALKDYSRAISQKGHLYVWGDSLYRYRGYDVAYHKPLLKPMRLNGVGTIESIDIWNQKDTVPHTAFLPLNLEKAVISFVPAKDGGVVTQANGSQWIWGDWSGSCYPKPMDSNVSVVQNLALDDTSVLPVNAIALEITNPAPYPGAPVTLKARFMHNTVKKLRFIVNGNNLAMCSVPVFNQDMAKQDCVFNDSINMPSLILKADKPDTLKGLVDRFQQTVALTRYTAPDTAGTVKIAVCATLATGGNEVCSPERQVTVHNLTCTATDYNWSLYQPGRWALSAPEINAIFRLDTASAWGSANTAEATDSDLTKGIVNFLGRDINTLLDKIDLSENNIIMKVDAKTGYDWLPSEQTFYWNPIHKAWITTKVLANGSQCVTHVSRDFHVNFRTAQRGADSVFIDGFKVPSYFQEDPGAQTITTSQIYHVVIAGKRERTAYISTSGNFKWTYWVTGYNLGRLAKTPYTLYTGYTWNGLVSKVHTTRGDQAEISVPYSIAGHNILGAYTLNLPKGGAFSFRQFQLNKNFYPQTIDYFD